jgi:hypothetical protein
MYARKNVLAHIPPSPLDYSPSPPYNRAMQATNAASSLPQGARPHAESLLEEMAAEADLPLRHVGARPPKMRYSHEGMADMLATNPWMSQNELAIAFGRTPAWVSVIVTSDAFQALLARRKAELVDPELRLTLQERFQAMTTKSLQVLQEKLAKPADQVSDQLALRAAELGAKALGLGGNAAPPPAPNPAEYLPALAERLMRLRSGPVEDARLVSPTAPEGAAE